MRAVLGLAAAVLLVAGVDLAAKSVAEGRIEDRARADVPGAGSVEADIDALPFLPGLLVAGTVAKVEVRLRQVPSRAVQLSQVGVALRGVELERDALWSGQARVTSIDRGTVSVELDAAALSRALRVPVTIAGGEVRTRAGRFEVGARPRLGRDGSLVLRSGGASVSLPVERTRLRACTASRVDVVGDRVRLSCDLDRVPPVLGGGA